MKKEVLKDVLGKIINVNEASSDVVYGMSKWLSFFTQLGGPR